MEKNKTILLLLFLPALPAAAAAQIPIAVSTPVAVDLPAPFAVTPPQETPVPPDMPARPPVKAPYADAWRLKSEPLDLKAAADELSRGPVEGQARLYALAADMYSAAGKDDKAARLLENYRLQGGRDKEMLKRLAYCYDRLGVPAEGAAVLERLAGLYPEDTDSAL